MSDGPDPIDTRLVRRLAAILNDTGLSEIEVERGGLKIRVARNISAAPVMQAYAPAPAYAYPQAYPPQPYAPPAAGYAQRPAYAPNSLGAGWAQQQDEARRGVRQGAMVPLGQVIANIRQGTQGRILDAGLEPGPNGRPAWRVRWAAANGRRIDFIVDAATGAIIGSSGY